MKISKLISALRDSHEIMQRGFIYVLCVGIIVWMMPRENTFKYDYQKGKPWMYESLIAPYDFAVRKPTAEVNAEMDDIRATKKLYFRFSSETWRDKVKEFRTGIEKKDLPALTKSLNAGVTLLDSVYSRGIIKINDDLENKNPEFEILLLNNQLAEERELKSFFTIQSAYTHVQREIRKMNIADKEMFAGLIANALTQNVAYDETTTARALQEELDRISTTRGMVTKGLGIVAKGEVVDTETYQILESLRAEHQVQQGSLTGYYVILGGYVMIVSLCLLLLYLFLALFRIETSADSTRVTFILLLITLMVVATGVTRRYGAFNIYILPFCMLPIIIRAFFDTRIALFTHLVSILIIGFMVTGSFQFVFIQMVAGIVAIFSVANLRRRSQFFFSSGMIFLAYCSSYFAVSIINEGTFSSVLPEYFTYFGGSVMLTLLAYPMIFILEKIFGLVSDVTLLELSDTNSPVLRQLSEKAPGTFQHSLQVANLAENAIFEIGGNALLVRAGALYHDVGKMDMPLYFIENQVGGVNPHDEISFEESARIIIEHVIRGVEIARKNKLPEQLIDFIRTHHGSSMVQYFYHAHIKNYPDEFIEKDKFRYPGPVPFSKETAVLMMADSVEAASRSLKNYSAESIDKLVETIIEYQLAEKQFVNADITMKDISRIKKIFKKKLLNIYHARVEYPR